MKNILLFLPSGFEIYETGCIIDVFGWNLEDGDKSTKLTTFGVKSEVIGCFNFKVKADIVLEKVDVNGYDALVIPGGFAEFGYYDDVYSENFLNLIKAFNAEKKIIATICVGSLPVAKAGLLDGKKGTTYNMKNGVRQNHLREFGVEVINERVVISGNIITSLNPSTGMDVAFKLLEMLASVEQSQSIQRLMGFLI